MRAFVLRIAAASPILAFCADAMAQVRQLPEPAGLELLAIGGAAALAVVLIKRRKK